MHRFQYKKRDAGVTEALWNEYTRGKQTLKELGTKYGKSHVWVRKHLDTYELMPDTPTPQPTIIVADTTFWGHGYGVCVFRSWNLRRNLWWGEVDTEKVAHYHYGRKILEDREWTFTGAVIDGRRGLASVFKDIPVQTCHFHQMKTVTRYLTRKPQTKEGQTLRAIMLRLTHSTEAEFKDCLTSWKKHYPYILTDKTIVLGTKHWYYTHKKTRSAYLSMERNLPYLFTYQKYPELNIPNTTNTIDGYFASLKKKVAAHHGLRKDRRFKVISELLNRS
jgi:hypothetical protein